jgi:hypothetical protein
MGDSWNLNGHFLWDVYHITLISILDFHGEALVNVISKMTLKVHLVNSKVDQGDIST